MGDFPPEINGLVSVLGRKGFNVSGTAQFFHTLMVGFPHSRFDEAFWYKMLMNHAHNSAATHLCGERGAFEIPLRRLIIKD